MTSEKLMRDECSWLGEVLVGSEGRESAVSVAPETAAKKAQFQARFGYNIILQLEESDEDNSYPV